MVPKAPRILLLLLLTGNKRMVVWTGNIKEEKSWEISFLLSLFFCLGKSPCIQEFSRHGIHFESVAGVRRTL